MTLRYAAFISYASSDSDFARKLHRALENYEVPRALGTFRVLETGKPNRFYPIFRDREELSAGQLGSAIEANLRASASLIVVCSPAAAVSAWVKREIDYFKSLPQGARVFAIISSAAPRVDQSGRDLTASCMPEALGAETLAADARAGKDEFNYAFLKLVAGLINLGPGVLRDREKIEDRRRLTRRAGLVASLTLSAMIGLCVVAELGRRADLARGETALMAMSPVGSLITVEPESAADAAQALVREHALMTPDEIGGEISAVGFSDDDTFLVLGLADGAIARFNPDHGVSRRTDWPRPCEDRVDTRWNDCAIFAVDVASSGFMVADASGTIGAFDLSGALVGERRVHSGPVVGLEIVDSAARAVSVGLAGDVAILSWPALAVQHRLHVDCRARSLRHEATTMLLSCASGRQYEISGATGAITSATSQARREIGEFQLSAELDERSDATMVGAPSGVRQLIARQGGTSVVQTYDGVYVKYRDTWLSAPFVDSLAYNDQHLELSRSGRYLVLNTASGSRWAVLDLADYVELDALIQNSTHLRQDVCRSRWAPRLANAERDPCAREGVLTLTGLLQTPQAFFDLWRR